jgi:rod shape-determining protein MreD
MHSRILNYIGLFLFLSFLQIFLFNNIQLSGYMNPYVYVLFILLLPYETPGWLLLTLGFIMGITIDIFMNTLGMHSSATVFLAFLRPYMLNLLIDREDSDMKGSPSISSNGFNWFLKYTVFLVLGHHLLLFFIESFSLSSFFPTLWRVILSTVTTSVFILFGLFFTVRR